MENINSKTLILIFIFMINQYVLGLENNLPLTDTRYVAERPSNYQDDFRNTRDLISRIFNLNQNEEDLDNSKYFRNDDLQDIINSFTSYNKKRTASKGKQWNQLHGLIGKRNGQWNQLNGMIGKRNELDDQVLLNLAGKREDPKSSNKQWNQLTGLIGKRNSQWNRLNGMIGKRSGQFDD